MHDIGTLISIFSLVFVTQKERNQQQQTKKSNKKKHNNNRKTVSFLPPVFCLSATQTCPARTSLLLSLSVSNNAPRLHTYTQQAHAIIYPVSDGTKQEVAFCTDPVISLSTHTQACKHARKYARARARTHARTHAHTRQF